MPESLLASARLWFALVLESLSCFCLLWLWYSTSCSANRGAEESPGADSGNRDFYAPPGGFLRSAGGISQAPGPGAAAA